MTYDGDDLKKVETQYFKPDGEKFASLTSVFKSSPLLPDSIFKDLRNNKTEETKIENKKFVVTTNNGKDVIKSGELDKRISCAVKVIISLSAPISTTSRKMRFVKLSLSYLQEEIISVLIYL